MNKRGPKRAAWAREWNRRHRAENTARGAAWRAKHPWYSRYYGLTPDEYAAIVRAQAGLCAICCQPLPETPGRDLNIDHDHATGRVRGVLCGTCNRGLGQFKDSIELLEAAINYLRKHSLADAA